ncbi:hypothetical protein GE21DRAFT_10454 [Neurospora crassa]|uniref:Kinetochore protein mis14 n=2 Tax=Neurospora crassa TaxID=5141 RepID=Q7S5A3_NEUCR|nr:hypothetical protein NCU02262 [Neurospora crassa OR74A]EAA30670.1 hypothetical protein NCU02262 [Neurospora crassa OR74A]KHE84869.1 hypothetical protein GE21DRAFT_10454 [Neurospora crassa]CAF05885.1 hypothetical protein [Neurospora crassa]|eukprot:XP_959906.1 hypothetical protein NCU02262 [Neurospora crassa OR74A]
MEMESAVHRRIELQSPEDFTYLIDNVRRAAADSINAAFPPVDAGDRNGEDEEEEDELRVRIEQLVDDYITKTFTYVAPNISINGLPVTDPSEFLSLSSSPLTSPSTSTTTKRSNGTIKKSSKSSSSSKIQKTKKSKKPKPPQEEYEPFDPRKRSRLETLAREEEDLLRSIALLKRRVPASAASALADSLARQTDADQKALDRAKQRVVEEGVVAGRKALEGLLPFVTDAAAGAAEGEDGNGSGDGDVTAGKGGNEKGGGGAAAAAAGATMERQEEIEDGFAKAVEALRRLKSQMPATVARMERARVAGGYVVAGVGGSGVVAAPGEGR